MNHREVVEAYAVEAESLKRKGYSNREIANRLKISEREVRYLTGPAR